MKSITYPVIDVRNLIPQEREKKIHPVIDNLKQGEAIGFSFEFNPLPLLYMLKAKGNLTVSIEKDGPVEWLLKVEKSGQEISDAKRIGFKELLKELKTGELTEETKEKAKKFLQDVDAKTLGILEQELIRERVSHDEIRESLCDIHLEVLRDSLVAKRIDVKPPHPIHTLMEEHKIILATLQDLRNVLARLKTANSYEEIQEDMEKLKVNSHHLVEAESHHKREEDALFPRLETHDIAEPSNIMRMDHVEFLKRKKELYNDTHNPENYTFEEYKKQVLETGGYLVKELESHIFKEDNILYQIALQVLSEQEWKEIQEECHAIGYCCFTPQ